MPSSNALVGLVINVPSSVFQTMQAELRTALPQLQVSDNSRFGGSPLSSAQPAPSTPSWWIQPALLGVINGTGASRYAVNLRSALSVANFSSSSLVPGALAVEGNPTSRLRDALMPTRMLPLLVRYNPSAFRAAGVRLPRSGWTINDFTLACTLLHNAIAKDKLKGLGVDQVLYPLRHGITVLGNQYQAVSLKLALLWETFIVGYGGTLVERGTAVHWDTAPAVQGIGTLMHIVQSFAGGQTPNSVSSAEAMEKRSAMQLVYVWSLVPPTGPPGLAPGFAPFPRLPARPTAPSNIQGVQLLYHSGPPPVDFGSPVPQSAVSEEAAAAHIAVRYLAWLYASPQQALLASAGVPPITSAALGRSAFWHEYGFGGQGSGIQFPYPWPQQANLVLNQGLPALAQSYLRNSASLKGQLQALSVTLTNALAAAG